MRHKKSRNRLNRFTSWRKATLASMVRNLFIYQSIRTTLGKAKAAQPLAENLVAMAKTGALSKKRQAFKVLCDHRLVSVLFNEIAQRFEKRASGFTRIIRLGPRRGDGAELAILELTELKKKETKKHKKTKDTKPEEGNIAVESKGAPAEEKHTEKEVAVKEKPPITKKPTKKFLGGFKNIFKKERDSL